MIKRLPIAKLGGWQRIVQEVWFVGIVAIAVVVGGHHPLSRIAIAAFFLGSRGTLELFYRRKNHRLAWGLFLAAFGAWWLAVIVDVASEMLGQVAKQAYFAEIGIVGTGLAVGFIGAIVVVIRDLRRQRHVAEADTSPDDSASAQPTSHDET